MNAYGFHEWRQGLRPLPLSAFLALGFASMLGAQSSIEVRASGDRVSVRAAAVALPEVLEALAVETGVRVEWDLSPPPRPVVTLDLEDRELSEAVPAILEGLGFNFALGLDASGRRVRELYIVGATPPDPAEGARMRWPARRWKPIVNSLDSSPEGCLSSPSSVQEIPPEQHPSSERRRSCASFSAPQP